MKVLVVGVVKRSRMIDDAMLERLKTFQNSRVKPDGWVARLYVPGVVVACYPSFASARRALNGAWRQAQYRFFLPTERS